MKKRLVWTSAVILTLFVLPAVAGLTHRAWHGHPHWRDASHIDDVAHGLAALARVITAHDIRSIAVPPLGCGLGGLPWHDVRQLIEHHLAPLDHVDIVVYGAAPG